MFILFKAFKFIDFRDYQEHTCRYNDKPVTKRNKRTAIQCKNCVR